MASRSPESADRRPDDTVVGSRAGGRPRNDVAPDRTGGRPPLAGHGHHDLDHVAADMLSSVLAGLTFPAHHWQIIATAESYGADAQTMTRLHRLGSGPYPSLRHITQAYAGSTPPRRGPPSR